MRILLMVFALTLLAYAEGKHYAVVVGIDRYERPDINPLRCAVADAHALAGAFRELQYDKVFELTSDDAGTDDYPNRVNVLFRLDWLRQRVQPEDTVVFFFSGHGVQQEDKSVKDPPVFLLTKESDARSLITLTNSACPASQITSILNQMTARRILVVYDACRSNVRADRGADDNRLSQDLARQLTPSQSDTRSCLVTLFSCSPGQRAYEAGGHGYFTACLLKGMSAKPPVTLQALLDYLPKAVSSAADEANLKQTPYWTVSGNLPASQWVLAEKSITFQASSGPLAAGNSRSHQDATQTPALSKSAVEQAWVGTWECVFMTIPCEKMVQPDGSFVDYLLASPGGPRTGIIRSGHMDQFSQGQFSWRIESSFLNQAEVGKSEKGSYRLQGNQAFLHYDTGGFDIVWTRK